MDAPLGLASAPTGLNQRSIEFAGCGPMLNAVPRPLGGLARPPTPPAAQRIVRRQTRTPSVPRLGFVFVARAMWAFSTYCCWITGIAASKVNFRDRHHMAKGRFPK